MRILLNASNLHKGGAVQVAASLVESAAGSPSHQWFFVVSSEVSESLPHLVAQDAGVLVIDMFPRKPGLALRTRRHLSLLERQLNPDVVFTVFGPPYWSPRSKHACGFAAGLMTMGSPHGAKSFGRTQAILTKAIDRLRRLQFKRSWHYWVETDAARAALSELIGIDSARIYTIPNTAHQCFLRRHGVTSEAQSAVQHSGTRPFTILCLAAYYPHKNLESVPAVANHLRSLTERKFQFWLTLPPESKGWRRIAAEARRLGVEAHVVTVGPRSILACPTLYSEADCVFLPTLAEIFSATYVESILMRKPLVTTDIPAARAICRDAALFFAPYDNEVAASLIASLINDQRLYRERVAACEAAAQRVVSPERRFEMILDMLEQVHDR